MMVSQPHLVDYIETTLLGYCELAQRNHTGQTALEVANANRNESIIAILSQEEDAEFVGAAGPADMIEFGGVIHPSEWSDYGIEPM